MPCHPGRRPQGACGGGGDAAPSLPSALERTSVPVTVTWAQRPLLALRGDAQSCSRTLLILHQVRHRLQWEAEN